MDQLLESIQSFFSNWGTEQLPSLVAILESMDTVAWILLLLMVSAIVVGIFFTINTRRTFLPVDDVEVTPDVLLSRLKQDPSRLSPANILSRLGAEATLDLLNHGDMVDDKEWIYKWGSIRNELLHLLSQQKAFGPIYALARYYRSEDQQEPDTLRIRRTVLIHKLGQRRFLEPNADGSPAELRIRCHPSEIVGDLGFIGSTTWLQPDEPAPVPNGPLIEMEPIEFHTLEDAELNLNIRRTPMTGGGFRLHLEKQRKYWIVKSEEIDWAS